MVSFLPILPLLVGLIGVRAGSTCYAMDGSAMTGADIASVKPCNPDAEFSACCTLDNGSAENDLCLDSGLCLSTYGEWAGLIWANGCTDPTGQAPECPHICDIMPEEYRFNVLQCQPGVFCCRTFDDNSNCCNTTGAIVKTSHIGSILLPDGKVLNNTYIPPGSSATASISSPSQSAAQSTTTSTVSESCPADHTAVVGGAVGGVLGAALIGALVALVLLNHRRSALQRKLDDSQGFGQQQPYYIPDAKANTAEAEAKTVSMASPPYVDSQDRPYEMDGAPGPQELSDPELHE